MICQEHEDLRGLLCVIGDDYFGTQLISYEKFRSRLGGTEEESKVSDSLKCSASTFETSAIYAGSNAVDLTFSTATKPITRFRLLSQPGKILECTS